MTSVESTDSNFRLNRIMSELTSSAPEHRVNPSLEGFKQLLGVMGDPQLSCQTIIVGGTNGKTSTTRAIAQLAQTLGLVSGLFTSPHLFDVRERIVVDGDMVSAAQLADTLERVRSYAALLPPETPRPTYFESLTAAAFEIFADTPVDLTVLEVGMGGKWDATNVTNPIAACLMPISLDHMEYLGDTVEKIATDKAQIIKPNSLVVVATQQPEAMAVIESRCQEVGSELLCEGRDFAVSNWRHAVGGQIFDLRTPVAKYQDLFLPLFGSHQASNVAAAITTISMALRSDEPPQQAQVEDALAQTSSPGRLEVVTRNPLMLIDACHNPGGAAVTANAIKGIFPGQKFVLVFAAMREKDVISIFEQLVEFCDSVIVTSTHSHRSYAATELAQVLVEKFPKLVVEAEGELASACERARDIAVKRSADTGVFVAGSVALAGATREWVQSVKT